MNDIMSTNVMRVKVDLDFILPPGMKCSPITIYNEKKDEIQLYKGSLRNVIFQDKELKLVVPNISSTYYFFPQKKPKPTILVVDRSLHLYSQY